MWLEWSEGERGSEGRGWGQVMQGLVSLWDGLGFYPEGGSWEPWRAVGRRKTGSNLGAQRRPLAAAGEHTVGAGIEYKSVASLEWRTGWLGTGKRGQLYPHSSLVPFEF